MLVFLMKMDGPAPGAQEKPLRAAADEIRFSIAPAEVKIMLESGERQPFYLGPVDLAIYIQKKTEAARAGSPLALKPVTTPVFGLEVPGQAGIALPSAGKARTADFRIDDNLGEFSKNLNPEIGQLLHTGDYAAALELITQAKLAMGSAQYSASNRLAQAGLDGVAEQLNLRFEEARKPLDTWETFCRLMASLYQPEREKPAHPLQAFDSMDPGRLASLIGAEGYAQMRSFFSLYEQVASPAAMEYSRQASEGLQEGFLAAESGLRALAADIRKVKSDEKPEELAERWHLPYAGRLALLQSLMGAYAQAAEDYQNAALLDMAQNNRLGSALASEPRYQAMDESQKAELGIGYENLAALKSAAAASQREGMARLDSMGRQPPAWAAWAATRPGTDPEHLLRSPDLGYFALCKSLGGLLPALADERKAQAPIFYDALKVRQLGRVLDFENALGPKMDVSSRVKDLARAAGERMVSGELSYVDIPHLMADFEKELGGHYASVGREMETGIMASKLFHPKTESDVQESVQALGQMYGKDALMLVAAGLAFGKSTRPLSQLLMNALVAWDVYDKDYAGAGTVLLAMYGGSRIPVLNRALPFGPQLQALAAGKMAVDGFSAAAQSAGELRYGFSGPAIFDAASSVMMGLIVPAYHGQVELKQARGFCEAVADMAGKADFSKIPVPFAMMVQAPVPDQRIGRDHWLSRKPVPNTRLYITTFMSMAPENVRMWDPNGNQMNFATRRQMSVGGPMATVLLKEGSRVRIRNSDGSAYDFTVKEGYLQRAANAKEEPARKAEAPGPDYGRKAEAPGPEYKAAKTAGGEAQEKAGGPQGGAGARTPASAARLPPKTAAYDAYEELGLPRTASVEEIRAARRKWVQTHQGAFNGTDPVAEAKYKAINAEILRRTPAIKK
ncbi:MAG: hypothetical protein KGH63_00160 [Candidatus Micrarchaeota archaeon]|nr:hypothetical protein [Candidatus Micrarchaeota archaeon]